MDPEYLNDKLGECMLMKDLRHPNVCKFKECFVSRKQLCILFDFCEKGDLSTYIKNQGKIRLSDTRIKKFLMDIILGIEYLHSNDIIHRDLKPSNIFLKGKDYTPCIGDFGEAVSTKQSSNILEDVGSLIF